MTSSVFSKPKVWVTFLIVIVIIGGLSTSGGRTLTAKLLGSLRMDKVQAVNVDLSPFVDANANPTLHQMVSQMISDKVEVQVNEPDQQAPDAAAATRAAGFLVQLLRDRKDVPKLIVGGEHKLNLSIDRARLQAIVDESGHHELSLPQSLQGGIVMVQIPRSLNAQYGTCPGPASASNAIASNITGPTPATTQFSDCVRLRESPSPVVNVPAGLDIESLAQIGLETGGMTPAQAHDFLKTVDWKSTLSMAVPRFLRSYQEVKVAGTRGTLLTMSGRRGPGYVLVWANRGMVYTLTGFGDSSSAVTLADSLQ